MAQSVRQNSARFSEHPANPLSLASSSCDDRPAGCVCAGAGQAARRARGGSDAEDEEMSTIFEIVRLAQERHAAEDHRADGNNNTFVDANGTMLPTLNSARDAA